MTSLNPATTVGFPVREGCGPISASTGADAAARPRGLFEEVGIPSAFRPAAGISRTSFRAARTSG